MLSLVGPRDEVLIPAPYWVSYPQMCVLCGATATVIPTTADDGYCLQPAALEAAITPASRLLILCNPSNPTGAVHPPALLRELAAVVARHPNLLVVADEIYEQITFDEEHVAFATLPGMWARTITINGFSKGAAMTGFRLGYLAAPTQIAKACAKVQSQNTSCPSSVAQHAGLAYLRDVPDAFATDNATAFRAKRDYVLGRLGAIKGVTCPTPQGAFYVFPKVSAFFGWRRAEQPPLMDAESVCLYLLEDWHLALVPGEAFGDPACLRISYATDMTTLTAAMDRFENGLNALSPPTA